MWKYSYLVHFLSFFGQVVNIHTFSRKCHFYFRFKMAAVFKLPFKWPLTVVLAMAPYPIFLSALKTVIMPIFVLLTESEQFKHISALLNVDFLIFLERNNHACWSCWNTDTAGISRIHPKWRTVFILSTFLSYVIFLPIALENLILLTSKGCSTAFSSALCGFDVQP